MKDRIGSEKWRFKLNSSTFWPRPPVTGKSITAYLCCRSGAPTSFTTKFRTLLSSVCVCVYMCMNLCNPYVCPSVACWLSISRLHGWRTGSGEICGFRMDVILLLMMSDAPTRVKSIRGFLFHAPVLSWPTLATTRHSTSLITSYLPLCRILKKRMTMK